MIKKGFLYQKYLLPYILCFFWQTTIPQENGNIPIRNYTPKEYKAHVQNWSIVQDKRGIMYFGNGDGILEYDGTSWRLIELPNKTNVYALSIDSTGRIYVGGSTEEFGFLTAEANGKMKYVSLTHLLDKEYLRNLKVMQILCVNNDIYFRSNQVIFRLRNGAIKILYDGPVRWMFTKGNQVYSWTYSKGLALVGEDSLQRIYSGDFFRDKIFNAEVPISEQKVLIGTFNKGLYTYDFSKSDSKHPAAFVSKFESCVDSFLIKNTLYDGILLDDGNIALGTINAGSVIMDKNGNVIQKFSKEVGLQNDMILNMLQDKEGNLWFALNQGISMVNFGSPIQYWNKQSGLEHLVKDIIRFNGTIYIADFGGLHYIKNNTIYRINDVFREVYCFCDFRIPNDTSKHILLAGTNNNMIVRIDGFKTSVVINASSVWCITQSFSNPSRVFIGTDTRLLSAIYLNESWKIEGIVQGIDDDIRAIVEDTQGDIWAGTYRNGVIRITPGSNILKPEEIIRYGNESGLPSLKNVLVYKYANKPLFATENGLYQFDSSINTFKPYTMLGKYVGNRDVFCFAADKQGRVYVSGLMNNKGSIEAIIPEGRTGFRSYNKPFKTIPEMMVLAMYAESDGTFWLGGTEGLFRFKGDLNPKYPDYPVLIRRVVAGKDSIIYWGNDSLHIFTGEQKPLQLTYNLDYNYNSLIFYYSAVTFNQEEATLFQSYLEGFDDDWSDWSNETKRIYTNLSEGSYTFHVKAKNIFMNESKEATYQFVILPPWYKTKWAILLYLVLFIAIVYGAIFLNSRRLKAKNLLLERIIRQRTAEIQEQKEEITSQRDDILEKNEILQQQNEEIMAQSEEIMSQRDMLSQQKTEIISSIEYALKIQKAVLPSNEILRANFSDFFVLYIPKDIVSGDFYWLKRIKNFVIFATADCTGHGVPGAFMSMLSISLLNEIVSKSRMDTSGEILNSLRKRIKVVLHQEGKEGEQKDGLDIALCVFDLENYTLQYSGAYNSLYLVRGNNLTVYKADRQPCAIYLSEKDFTTHEIPIRKDDIFYTFSDGFSDQIGGQEKSKFMSRNFREYLLQISKYSLNEQKEMLLDKLESWKGNEPQIDDITVIGIKI